jgi:hypothetical protein
MATLWDSMFRHIVPRLIGPDFPSIETRQLGRGFQIGMFRPIRVDHTNCLQVVIKTHSFSSPSPPSSFTPVNRCISSHNANRQTLSTSVKLTYLSVYDNRDGVSEHAAPPSPPSSLTHVHRCIGSRNTTRQILTTSPKLTYLRVYDNRGGVSEHTDSPSPPSSLTHVHRCIGSRNPSDTTYLHRFNATRQTLPTSTKPTYLRVYDNRNDVTQCM